jgi:transposase InsO family protein
MYSQTVISDVLNVYDQVGSIKGTIATLGYPARNTLREWIRNRQLNPTAREHKSPPRGTQHRHNSLTLIELVLTRIEAGEAVKKVAAELDVSLRTVYSWLKRSQIRAGKQMSDKSKRPLDLHLPDNPTEKDYQEHIKQLEAHINDMQMDIDIAREIQKILKKDMSISQKVLNNQEKASVADALRNRYTLASLCDRLGLAGSTYHNCRQIRERGDKYTHLRKLVIQIFNKNFSCYGYRRIKQVLERCHSTIISEKVIRRIMKEEGLRPHLKARAKYSSYMRSEDREMPNLLQRDFSAEQPNRKWVTDITEFKIPDGKVYLSAIIDCYDGYVVGHAVGTSPTAELANTSLKEAIGQLPVGEENTVIHSDRGGHYFWPEWVKMTQENGLKRSMSRKACTADNAACEGFFGRMKMECFYGKSFTGFTPKQFKDYLKKYIRWYNRDRVKSRLNGLSPVQFRLAQGLI